MKFPVFDLHCDTAFAMLGENFEEKYSLQKNHLHIDLERAKVLPGYAQCFACFTSDRETLPLSLTLKDLFARELKAFLDGMTEAEGKIKQARSAYEILENQHSGVMSGILTIEGPAGFDYDAKMLEYLYDLGFRITTLGWNERNPLTGSHMTGGGLTFKGREYVREAQRLGMLVDVSHISDEGFWDVIDITSMPIIATHSNSRAVWNVSRNLTDEMFTAICQSNGVVGINLYGGFLGDDPDLDTVCDHILHFMELDPAAKHICLGGDLDGCDELPKGFGGIQDYPKLSERMLKRGICEATVYDIFWNNAIGVMRNAVCKHPE